VGSADWPDLIIAAGESQMTTICGADRNRLPVALRTSVIDRRTSVSTDVLIWAAGACSTSHRVAEQIDGSRADSMALFGRRSMRSYGVVFRSGNLTVSLAALYGASSCSVGLDGYAHTEDPPNHVSRSDS
jgi:hypothetical protein